MRVRISRLTVLLGVAVLATAMATTVPALADPSSPSGSPASPSTAPSGTPSSPESPTSSGPATSAPSGTRSSPASSTASSPATTAPPGTSLDTRRACPAPTPGHAACLSLVRTDVPARKGRLSRQAAPAGPAGYAPADLVSAYALPASPAGTGATVAIVDSFDDPTVEADLATYRSQYGLPACTTANGCFRKVAQDGSTNYPVADSGWSTEISLDVDMVSAICPACHILLVEATDNSFDSLAASVDEAVSLGAQYVSNSYGTAAGEDPPETSYDSHYSHPGVVITASTGDNGYGVEWPAVSPGVTAVGGTHLVRDSTVTRGWTESAWTGAGSGCSQYEDKPAWQADLGCAKRAVADVSADADPATGVAVYDTYQSGGWQVFGGTSVASPIIASVYALAGTPNAATPAGEYPYDAALVDPASLNDVTSGSNGKCDPAYLCNGEPGYDGPTGLGTPNAVAAFAYHAHGDLAGTVTDTGGHPVAGATVAIPGRHATSDAFGHYDLDLPAGPFTLTASAYGYQDASTAATVTAGQTTTHDVVLTALPRSTVSGTVMDGSGHGWGLYAKVSWDDGAGHTGVTFTDPASGKYTLALLQNTSYALHVEAVYPGYQPVDQSLQVGTADLTQDIKLLIDAVDCTAPGYGLTYRGSTTTFDTTAGWQVSNVDEHWPGYQSSPGWALTDAGGRGNTTGGSGAFAIVDSDHTGAMHYQDTYLQSPTIDMSGDASPGVQFATDLQPAVNSTASVELSVDNGHSWATVWTSKGFPGHPGPGSIAVALMAAAHKARVRVRFHYTGSWSKWWSLDDVFLGDRACGPTTGGLIIGQVTNAPGMGVVGAKVASVANPQQSATTVATPDDPARGDGLYWLFTTGTGPQRFTATATGYQPASATATIVANQITPLDLTLTPTSG